MRSFSQLQQDIEVLKYYDYKHNGYFVEIGASDGIELSNTYLLETEYNWKGICVEPIPERYDLLLHRPKRKIRQTFYKKIKNCSVNLFGDINALLKSIILFDDYNQLRL